MNTRKTGHRYLKQPEKHWYSKTRTAQTNIEDPKMDVEMK